MYEYEKCFQPLIEKGASRHVITAEDPNLVIAVDSLVNSGVIVGQGTLLEQDVIYFLNPEQQPIKLNPVKSNGEPLYLTPQERLSRPTSEQIRQERRQRGG